MMNRYSYTIHKNEQALEKKKTYYLYEDLAKMTTYQLREICYREKLVKNLVITLDREEIIRLIMRFRGKKETAWIQDFRENGLEIIEDALKRVKLYEHIEHKIKIPARMVVYKGIDLDYYDRCYVKTELNLDEGNLLLVDEFNQVYSIFNMKKNPESIYYIEKSNAIPMKEIQRKQYSILYFSGKDSDFLYDLYYGNINTFPPAIEVSRIPIIDLQIKELAESDIPLVIDFGTSNTTVGTFNEFQEYKVVQVLNKTVLPWEETCIIPSVIGIKNIFKHGVEYRFGYDALEIVHNNYLDEELPVFYDIKRWINDIDRMEKVMSADGAYLWLRRSDLLKLYLEYIINTSVQRFKKRFRTIQILSPVRQQEKFKQVFKELDQKYEFDCSLDEGVAVLFDSIRKLIQSDHYQRNYWYKALIIDCGGGTTDLTSSRFKIENNRVSYQITLESSYENGDTNFGGNNLTFRILQLLKARLVDYWTGQNKTANLQCLKENNFRYIDEKGIDFVYQELNHAYDEAEDILPTRFLEYEQAGAHEYFKVKNNYFYLFDLAEKIKTTLFMDEEFYELVISWKYQKEKNNDFRKAYLPLDKWKLSIRKDNAFLNQIPEGELLFRLSEIRSLLMGDIYNLIRKFLEQDFEDGNLSEYELIKLTGQSCQAGLFVEAMKEYIPGKVLHSVKRQKDSHDLKICCLNGALFYFQNKKMGYMDISHSYHDGALPYALMAKVHTGHEKILVPALQKKNVTGYISRFIEGDQIEIMSRDPEGNILKKYNYHYSIKEMQITTFEEIEQKYYGRVIQDETDNIVNGESKFFVWIEKSKWGFYIFPVYRNQENLYSGEACFFSFEDDTWEENFFDGKK